MICCNVPMLIFKYFAYLLVKIAKVLGENTILEHRVGQFIKAGVFYGQLALVYPLRKYAAFVNLIPVFIFNNRTDLYIWEREFYDFYVAQLLLIKQVLINRCCFNGIIFQVEGLSLQVFNFFK